MLRAAISLRTAAQRRSSSAMEIGVWTRSIVAMAVTSYSEFHDMADALGLAVHKRAQIVDKQRHHLVGVFLAHAADMRGDDHVGHVPERAVGWQRLFLEHVEAGACYAFGRERLEQRVLIDHAAAGDVNE